MSEPNNPFSGLLGVSEPKANTNADPSGGAALEGNSKNMPGKDEAEAINNIVENVFHITINGKAVDSNVSSHKQLVYLEELADAMKPRTHIDLEALEQALFERLLLPDIETSVIPRTSKSYLEHVVQKQVFPYLFSSIQNLQSYDQVNAPVVQNGIRRMRELIFRNAVTALKQPALFEGQDFSMQVVELLQHVDPQCHSFFIDIVNAFVSDGKYIVGKYIYQKNIYCTPK